VSGGLIGIGLQIYELTRLPFFPGSSGYASCFIGWACVNIGGMFAGTYWIETVLARATRLRKNVESAERSAGGTTPSTVLFRANVESSVYFWGYLGLVSVLFWVLFYIV
jgi:hypothetical protein